MKWLAVIAAAVGVGALLGVKSDKETSMAKWELIAPPIRDPLDVNDLLFEGGTGLVVGERLPFEKSGILINDLLARSRGVILRLGPGAKEWEEVFSGRGAILRVSSTGGARFRALGEAYFTDGTRAQFMEESLDGGKSWKPGPPPPDGAIGISFAAGGRGWAWTARSVFSSSDEGKTWREVVQLAENRFRPGHLEPAFDMEGGVWVPDGSRVARVLGEEVVEFPFPDGTELGAIAVAPDGAAWAAVQAGAKGPVRVHRLGPGRPPELLSELPGFLTLRLQVGKGLTLLAACDVGVGDQRPTYFMLASRDGGKTWTREKPAKESVLEPLYFENDEVVWAYANFGKIQRRTPR